MTDSFVVYLGGGLYLNSEGKLTTGPQSSRDQVYLASELKFDFIEAGKTLMEVSSFLTDEKTHERIVKLHISTVPMSVLWKGAEILGAATMLLSAAAFTLGAFKALIELIEGKPEAISPLLQLHLLQIKEDLKAIDDRLTSDAILSVLSNFRKTLTTFWTNLQETTIQNLKGAARIAKHVELQDDLDALDNALGTLMTQDWSPLYRFDNYKQLFFLAPTAALHVRNPDGSYSPYVQRDVVRRFDYRLGLTILGYVASVYPVLVATAVPWFRSSGSYAARLRQLANCIDDFAKRMYSECFARTLHTPDSMAYSEGSLPVWHMIPDGSTTLMLALGRRLTLQNEYPSRSRRSRPLQRRLVS